MVNITGSRSFDFPSILRTYSLRQNGLICLLQRFDFLHDGLLERNIAVVNMFTEIFHSHLHGFSSVHDRNLTCDVLRRHVLVQSRQLALFIWTGCSTVILISAHF